MSPVEALREFPPLPMILMFAFERVSRLMLPLPEVLMEDDPSMRIPVSVLDPGTPTRAI